MLFVVLFVLGAVLGSFVAALTWRVPRGISIAHGRSFCTKCKTQINWYDNIPLVSFLFLKGRCRSCNKKISIRYFYIELFGAASACLLYYFYARIVSNLSWTASLSQIILFLFLAFVVFLSISIFVVDWEHQIIPDEFALLGFTVGVVVLLVAGGAFFTNMLSGFSAALFLLSIVLATKGRGMGLGDVKLALFYGLVLGPKNTFVWIFLSFIIGAVFGLVLILMKKSSLKSQIAFGPFLVISFLLTLVYGQKMFAVILPYIN